MTQENLMIGNWIEIVPFHDKKKSYYKRIESGSDLDAVFDFQGHIRPIHITPEILGRNGIVLDKGHYLIDIEIYVSEDRRIEISHISNMTGKDWSIHIDNKRFETIGGASVEYVHELQNILKLCGIDKKIVL